MGKREINDEHLNSGVATAVENRAGLERLDGGHGDGDGTTQRDTQRGEWRLSVWRWWNEKARSAQGGFGHGLGFGARAARAGRAEGSWRVPLLEFRGSPGFRPGRPALVYTVVPSSGHHFNIIL